MNIESPAHIEEEPEMKHVHRFFEIDTKTETALKERIQKSKGLIRLFVHPDFEEYTTFTGIKDDKEAVQKLLGAEKVFQKILSSVSPDAPPIFIFEGGADQKEFEAKEQKFSRLAKQDTFVIRTEHANPNPLPPDYEKKYEAEFFGRRNQSDKESSEAMWQWIIEEFKKWGVKEILVGGLELYISPEYDVHAGCLGHTMAKFKDHFNIDFSTTTWPSGRKDLKKKKAA